MISLLPALEQMAWADRKLFAALEALPDDVWRARASEDEWQVVGLMFHLVASADWYAFQLGRPRTITAEPDSIADVRALGGVWQEIDDFLVAQAVIPDAEVEYSEDGERSSALRSTVLTEAVIHAVEHRVQIEAALKRCGHRQLDLEGYSAWAYVSEISSE